MNVSKPSYKGCESHLSSPDDWDDYYEYLDELSSRYSKLVGKDVKVVNLTLDDFSESPTLEFEYEGVLYLMFNWNDNDRDFIQRFEEIVDED